MGASAAGGWLELDVDMGDMNSQELNPDTGSLQPEKEVLQAEKRTISGTG